MWLETEGTDRRLTLESGSQQASSAFHQVVGRIGAAGKAVAHLTPIEQTAWPETLKAGVCGVCIHLHWQGSLTLAELP